MTSKQNSTIKPGKDDAIDLYSQEYGSGLSAASLRTGNLLSELEQTLADAVERSQSRGETVDVEVTDTDEAYGALCGAYPCLEIDSAEVDGYLDVWGDDGEGGAAFRLRLSAD